MERLEPLCELVLCIFWRFRVVVREQSLSKDGHVKGRSVQDVERGPRLALVVVKNGYFEDGHLGVFRYDESC